MIPEFVELRTPFRDGEQDDLPHLRRFMKQLVGRTKISGWTLSLSGQCHNKHINNNVNDY